MLHVLLILTSDLAYVCNTGSSSHESYSATKEKSTGYIFINLRHMHRRVMVVVWSVCVSVCYHASCYIPCLYVKIQYMYKVS